MFKQPDHNERLKATKRQELIDCYIVDGYFKHCKMGFKAMGCYFHFCLCHEARLSLIDDDVKQGTKNEKWMSFKKITVKKNDTP